MATSVLFEARSRSSPLSRKLSRGLRGQKNLHIYLISMNTGISRKTVHRREPIAEDNIMKLTPDKNKANGSKDAAFAVYICRRYLKLLGVWLHIGDGLFSWRTVLSNVAFVVCYLSVCIRLIPVIMYIIFDEKRPTEKLRLIVRCVFVCMSALKYTFLQSHRKKIGNCMKHMEFDWQKLECAASRDIMLEYTRFGHLITKICLICTYSGATFQALTPIVVANLLADNSHGINSTVTPSPRRFAIPSHFGHPIFSKTPIYQFIYGSQEIATILLHSIAIACYSLAAVIGMHACGQLKILMAKLNEIVDGGGKMTAYEGVGARMSDIIRHHVRVLRFVSSAEKILRGICLVEVAGCTFAICGLGYFCMMEIRKEVKQAISICTWTTLLAAFGFNVFSVCYVGQLLTEECMRVGEVAYMIDWHRLPKRQCLNLGLMISMTHNPVTLSAGGTIQLSFRCFACVVRTGVGYLNVLRTLVH